MLYFQPMIEESEASKKLDVIMMCVLSLKSLAETPNLERQSKLVEYCYEGAAEFIQVKY